MYYFLRTRPISTIYLWLASILMLTLVDRGFAQTCNGLTYTVNGRDLYGVTLSPSGFSRTDLTSTPELPFTSVAIAKAFDNSIYSVNTYFNLYRNNPNYSGDTIPQVYRYDPATQTGAYIPNAYFPAAVGSSTFIISGATDASGKPHFIAEYGDFLFRFDPATNSVSTVWSSLPPTAVAGPNGEQLGSPFINANATNLVFGPSGEIYLIEFIRHIIWRIPNPASPQAYYVGKITGSTDGLYFPDIIFKQGNNGPELYVLGVSYTDPTGPSNGVYLVDQNTYVSTQVPNSEGSFNTDIATCDAFVPLCPSTTISSVTPTLPVPCDGSNGSLLLSGLASQTTYVILYSVDGAPSVSVSLTANASGHVTLEGLSTGSYSLTATASRGASAPTCVGEPVTAELSCPMPVNLLSFSGKPLDGQVLLGWTTAWERNNDGFYVQKSADGLAWERVGFVKGKGTTAQANNYEYFDEQVSLGETYYYRLQQTDQNGQTELSKIIAVRMENGTQTVDLFPNPNLGKEFTIVAGNVDQIEVRLISITGQELPVQLRKNGTRWQISTTSPVPAGIYTVVVTNAGKSLRKSFKMVVEGSK